MHVRLIRFQTGPLFNMTGESYGFQTEASAKWQTLFFYDVSTEQLTDLWFGASILSLENQTYISNPGLFNPAGFLREECT